MKCVIDYSGLNGIQSDRNTKSLYAPESNSVFVRAQINNNNSQKPKTKPPIKSN